MMPNLSRILLVEGSSDRQFYEQLCVSVGLQAKVHVAPPKELGGEKEYNTKGGIFTFLPSLIQQMADGRISHLGTVMDADYADADGMGCSMTIDKFAALVEPYGFFRRYGLPVSDGLSFRHNDGLADLGLWVMPNNHGDGMMEDWIKSAIVPGDIPLLEYAIRTLDQQPFTAKFKRIHRAKAEVATWLAWQRVPGQGLHQALRNDLLDLSCGSTQALIKWLHRIYK